MIGLTDFDLPLGWQWQRLKFLLSRNDGGAWGSDPDDDGGVIVLRSTEQSVDGRWIIDEPARRKLSHREFVSTKLAAGDLVLTKSSGSELHIGKTTLVTEDVAGLNASFSNFMQRLRPRPELHPRFAWYFLNCALARTQFDVLSNSTSGLANLNATVIGEIQIPQVALNVQQKVVNFLDRETAEIDALIEKQELLIGLLEEKRQAFISHAVTKGLDPTVPMKDSGIPWVGLIPAHWELQKLRTLVTIEKRIAGTLGYDVFSITQRGLKVKDLDSADGQHSMDYSKYQIVEPGDFAMNHMDLLTGYVDIAESQGVTSPDYRVFRLKPSSSVLARFLLLVLQDAYRRRVLYAFGQGSSNLGRWRLPSEAFYGFPVTLPSQSEQLEIVSEVARFEDDTEKLVSACRKAAHVLRERRASLISAAVTGKIDVTGRV